MSVVCLKMAHNGRGYETERISELHQYPPLQNLLRDGKLANPCNRYVLYPLLGAAFTVLISKSFYIPYFKFSPNPRYGLPIIKMGLNLISGSNIKLSAKSIAFPIFNIIPKL